MSLKKIALFASGRGSNALNLINYFKGNPEIEIAFVLCNKIDAPIVNLAKKEGVDVFVCSNQEVEQTDFLKSFCNQKEIDFIILSGFLRKIPSDLIQAYENKIINIHPALLPNYGGEGMYGIHVHQAVLKNNEKKHGITIHVVNEEYDKGEIINQYSFELVENETIETIQEKIHELEQKHFPKVVEQYILN